jgi:hypothetical protein
LIEKTQNIILIALLIILLAVQLWYLFRQQNLKRKTTKVILNLLFWLSLVLLIFSPKHKNAENISKIGIKDNAIPSWFEKKIKDSLQITKVISISQYQKEFAHTNSDIVLLGQNFDPEFLSTLSNHRVTVAPYWKENELRNLNWRATLFQNETQEINGSIYVQKEQILRIKFGNKTLDSTKIGAGIQHFSLSYPSFSLGKTEVDLYLDNEPLSSIKYFSRAAPKLNILILAENPDFETKMLSEWLGKNGHTVDLEIITAKNTTNKTAINKNSGTEYQIVFSTPQRIENPVVSKVLKTGGAAFIYNLSEKDIPNINKKSGEVFNIQRINAESEVKLQNDLVGLPFAFKDNKQYQKLQNWPIAVSNKKVGVSLIAETYPLLLSGDSLTYRKIWGSVLGFLQPALKNNIEIDAPVLPNLFTTIRVNNFNPKMEFLPIKNDTLFVKLSPINSLTNYGKYVFRKDNWQPINDSLEVFVNQPNEPYLQLKQTTSAVYSFANKGSKSDNLAGLKVDVLPDWLRLLLCLLFFAALWIEAKL